MKAWGILIKYNGEIGNWNGPWYNNNTPIRGLTRLGYRTKEEADTWIKRNNMRNCVSREFEASNFCVYRDELFDRCDFCECWKKNA